MWVCQCLLAGKCCALLSHISYAGRWHTHNISRLKTTSQIVLWGEWIWGLFFFFLLKVFIYIHFPFYPVFNRTFRGVKQMRQKPQSLQLISLLWIATWLTKHNISVLQKVVFSSSYGSPCIPFTPEEIYSRCWWIFWRCACASLVQTRHQKYEGMDSWEGRLALLLAACFEAVGDRWVACCCWCFLQDQFAQCGPKYQ